MKTNTILKNIAVLVLLGYYFYNSVFLILISENSKNYIGGDFGVFYAAAKMMKEKIPLYNENATKYIRKIKGVPQFFVTGSRYLYPPPFAFLIRPILHFNLKTASIIWFFTNQIVLFLALCLIAIVFKRGRLNLNDLILILITANFYYPIYQVFKTGQINIYLLFFSILFLFFCLREKTLLISLIVFLFSLIKPFYIIFMLWLLLKKKTKILLYSCVTVIILNTLFIGISGIDQNIIYYKKILPKLITRGITSEYKNSDNSTINGFIYRNFDKNKRNNSLMNLTNRQLKKILFATQILALLAGISLLLYKNNQNFEIMTLDFSFLLICFFLLQKYSHLQYLIFLLLPIFNCFYLILKLRERPLMILLGISFILIGYPKTFTKFLENIPTTLFLDLRIYGQLLLLGIVVYLILYTKKFLTVTNKNENPFHYPQIPAADWWNGKV